MQRFRQVVDTFTRTTFAHTRQISYYVFHCLVRARIVFLKRTCLALPITFAPCAPSFQQFFGIFHTNAEAQRATRSFQTIFDQYLVESVQSQIVHDIFSPSSRIPLGPARRLRRGCLLVAMLTLSGGFCVLIVVLNDAVNC